MGDPCIAWNAPTVWMLAVILTMVALPVSDWADEPAPMGNPPRGVNLRKQISQTPMGRSEGSLSASGRRRLMKELEMLKREDSLGIQAFLAKNENGEELLEEWDFLIAGPPDSLYDGYTLHAKMHFPSKYPFQPPTFKFITPMFHPNIYADGVVCISILHPEPNDPTDTENENCAWTPGQNVRTICLSIISLLTAPNIFSPANVDASKMLRDDPDVFEETVKNLLEKSKEKECALKSANAQNA